MRVFVSREVVEDVQFPATQVSLEDAKKVNKSAAVGEMVEYDEEKVSTFGRVAAQTAKQVVLQRLREAERESSARIRRQNRNIINGIVTRVEPRVVRLDLGKAQGIMPMSEQIQGERYYPSQRIKVFLKEIERGFRGPQLILSRGCPEFIELLFRNEVLRWKAALSK